MLDGRKNVIAKDGMLNIFWPFIAEDHLMDGTLVLIGQVNAFKFCVVNAIE